MFSSIAHFIAILAVSGVAGTALVEVPKMLDNPTPSSSLTQTLEGTSSEEIPPLPEPTYLPPEEF